MVSSTHATDKAFVEVGTHTCGALIAVAAGCGIGALVGIEGELFGRWCSESRLIGEVEAVDDCGGGLVDTDGIEVD